MTDQQFWKFFGILTLSIVIIAIVIAILSNIFASYSFHPSNQYESEIKNSQQIRTEPLGKINLASNPTIKQETPVVVASSGPVSGKDIYNNVCMSCHTSGAAGAPVIGNSGQWSERMAKGKNALYSNAINGIGVMPAKGGLASLSDDEVKAAVDYILDESN
tara:strand:+ start:396 stop:878 length:483 start_codon:yes stop_codon:yes gene_type:complete